MIACVILYVDYGFWNERYIRDGLVVVDPNTNPSAKEQPESPGEMLSRFYTEAHDRFQSIDTHSGDFFKGKETYENSDVPNTDTKDTGNN